MNYLDYFKKLCEIPHGSGNIEKISKYLTDFANELGLENYRDNTGNVVIIKEASKGREADEPIIIQGHMDMVAVKEEGALIDMTKDGLFLDTDGDFLFAKGTSLGGDDGIAVAYAMDLLSNDYNTPRIEAVITVDEETGMDGAKAIDLSMLKGHTMLNLDSEEEGIFLVGCAGGARVDFCYDLTGEPFIEDKDNLKAYEIEIGGLLGGHSGTEIDKHRGNAIRIMCKILKKLFDAGMLQGIGNIKGGTADNVIAGNARALILAKNIESEFFDMIKYESIVNYMAVEKNVCITCKEKEKEGRFYPAGDFLHFLTSLPDGVMAMSEDVPGLVETSLNHGTISMQDGKITIGILLRSGKNNKRDELIETLRDLTSVRPVSMTVYGEYNSWEYRQDSPLRDRLVEIYEEMFKKKPLVQILHAGLECGILTDKIPNLDCVSFGPNIYDIHSTKEKISISSAERTWQLILKFLSTAF